MLDSTIAISGWEY